MTEPVKIPAIPVRVNAVVDSVTPTLWRVTATGLPPHAETRVYEIEAKTDNVAAQEGIRRFVEEMQARPPGGV